MAGTVTAATASPGQAKGSSPRAFLLQIQPKYGFTLIFLQIGTGGWQSQTGIHLGGEGRCWIPHGSRFGAERRGFGTSLALILTLIFPSGDQPPPSRLERRFPGAKPGWKTRLRGWCRGTAAAVTVPKPPRRRGDGGAGIAVCEQREEKNRQKSKKKKRKGKKKSYLKV